MTLFIFYFGYNILKCMNIIHTIYKYNSDIKWLTIHIYMKVSAVWLNVSTVEIRTCVPIGAKRNLKCFEFEGFIHFCSQCFQSGQTIQ